MRSFFPLNTGASVPDLRLSDQNQNFRASDFFVHDGSYLRMKEVRLSYNVPQSLLQKVGISSLAFSLTATNLLTLTGYSIPRWAASSAPRATTSAWVSTSATIPRPARSPLALNSDFEN